MQTMWIKATSKYFKRVLLCLYSLSFSKNLNFFYRNVDTILKISYFWMPKVCNCQKFKVRFERVMIIRKCVWEIDVAVGKLFSPGSQFISHELRERRREKVGAQIDKSAKLQTLNSNVVSGCLIFNNGLAPRLFSFFFEIHLDIDFGFHGSERESDCLVPECKKRRWQLFSFS